MWLTGQDHTCPPPRRTIFSGNFLQFPLNFWYNNATLVHSFTFILSALLNHPRERRETVQTAPRRRWEAPGAVVLILMGNSRNIPDIVVGRLPVYLRALSLMLAEQCEYTSSHELGERLGISSAQIRKDLSHFGEFGKQGTGYNVAFLHEQIRQILHVDREWPMAVVGAGDLGRAIVHYRGFVPRGFRVVCVFDNKPERVGEEIAGIVVQPMEKLAEELSAKNVQVAMIAVPLEAAQDVADQLVQAGVRAILNYAPINISVPPDVQVQYIDPVVHLQHMTFYLK